MIITKRNKSGVLCYWDDVLNASKVKSPKEEVEQIALVTHSRYKWPKISGLMLHPVNEGDVKPQYRTKIIRSGLLKGASDWLVLVPANGLPYLVIELKRSRKQDSSIKPDQVKFLLNAEKVGAYAVAAYGYIAALQAMEDYFAGKFK